MRLAVSDSCREVVRRPRLIRVSMLGPYCRGRGQSSLRPPSTLNQHTMTSFLHSAKHSRAKRPVIFVLAAVCALAVTARALWAHDFWIVPNAFAVQPGSTLVVRGQTSTRFPTSVSAVATERVAEARLLGAESDDRIADLSVEGRSLILRARPATVGQRIVAIALVPRTTRTSPQALQRYIALEGAQALSERYAREGRFTGTDSLTQRTTKLAKTIVDVGVGGPRAFARAVGHALELVPLTDPAAARAGDTLAVRLMFRGVPVPDAHLHAGVAMTVASGDSVAATKAAGDPADVELVTDSQGVARLPFARSGVWNVRTVYAAPAQGESGVWEVYFVTLVVQAGSSRR